MNDQIAVVGAGSWGTALAMLLHQKGFRVGLWARDTKIVEEISEHRSNSRYLPGISIPKGIWVSHSLEEVVQKSRFWVLAVPSHAIRKVAVALRPFLSPNTVIVNTAKGLEEDTLQRMSEIIKQELFDCNYIAVLSGPSHAEEVCRFNPTAVVVSSVDQKCAELVQDVFIFSTFRVYINPDLIGVELGGALKNVIALATGIADGLGLGDNARAALITRGLAEITRLGTAMGANPLTFAGLTGIGDLIVTCNSMHSRNRRAGIEIGKGKPLDEVLEKVGMVVEGVKTTRSAWQLAKKFGIEMPITNQVYNLIFGGKDPALGVAELMQRQKKPHELEEVATYLNQ
ncbi:MAG: NAD(P)H-dependent glycerol-3-phosphate dehydrogenase [Bacillota bacterium]